MSAAAAIDFSRLAKLGLARQTQQALAAFRKRATDAQIQAAHLKEAKADVDFAHYRNILKNKAIVEEGEKLIKAFKPVTYDVDAQLKAISAFEGKAVTSAQEAATKVEAELANLNSTLKNIEDARPFDQLTLDDVAKARPEITQAVENMIKKGKWTVPGYTEKFGNLSAI